MSVNQCLFLLFFFLLSVGTNAQFQNRFSIGLKSGVGLSSISGISETIYPEDFWKTSAFSFDENARFGYAGGLFVNYKSTDYLPLFAVQTELGFRMGGVSMKYKQPKGVNNNNEPYPELNYDMDFRYNYLDFNTIGKFYPFARARSSSFKGFNVGLGAQVSFNLSPDKIFYSSNAGVGGDPVFEDVNNQNQLRLSLLGKTDVIALVNLGYELPMGVGFDIRYGYGFVDSIETIFNFYDFINNTNNSEMVQFTVSYVLE